MQASPLLPVKLVQGDKGKRGGFRVDYKTVLASILQSSDSAARDGVMLQQVRKTTGCLSVFFVVAQAIYLVLVDRGKTNACHMRAKNAS
jgi:hypothetical protein